MSIVCIQYGYMNEIKEQSNGTGYENRKTLALPSHLPERSLGKTDICGLGSLPGGEILAAGGVTVGIGRKKFWRGFWGFLGDDWINVYMARCNYCTTST